MIEYNLQNPEYARKLEWMYSKIADHEKSSSGTISSEVQYAVKSTHEGSTVAEFIADAREFFELNAKNPPCSNTADGK